MSELQLRKISKDLIDRADRGAIPPERLGQWFDDYFVDQLKRAEMEHAEVDTKLYEGLRVLAKAEVLPLYDRFQKETERIRHRRDGRKLWRYVLGTVGVLEILEVWLTRGRSMLPQVLVPTAIFYSFLGFVIYTAAQYLDDRLLTRARREFEAALEGIDQKVLTDVNYDNRRDLMQAEVLRAEALEILLHYERPEDFWRDYQRIREADPTTHAMVAALNAPAFDKFLKFHVQGGHSATARQHRFNRLFLEAQEVFVSRNREHYAMQHLKTTNPPAL
ncbi:MAG: hypothetical protein U1G07_26905 [Verrucomicrobiota bacterium]